MNSIYKMEYAGSPDSECSEPPRPSSTELPNSRTNKATRKKPGCEPCTGCGNLIFDRWMLHVGNDAFHMSCLRCSVCLRTLDTHKSCYIRDKHVFCKNHYLRIHGTTCVGCGEPLLATDWIRKARDKTFHVHCFRCYICHCQLLTGDTFVFRNDVILCMDHCDVTLSHDDGDNVSVSSVESDSRGSEAGEEKGRRVRANFTREQVMMLMEAFCQNPMPTSDMVDFLAAKVGFPRKVILIWFQNARARTKKQPQYVAQQLYGGEQGYSGVMSQVRNPRSPCQPIVIE